MILLVKSQIYVCTLIQQRVFSTHLNDPDQCWISNIDYNHTTVAPINTTISWYSERYETDRAVKKKPRNWYVSDQWDIYGVFLYIIQQNNPPTKSKSIYGEEKRGGKNESQKQCLNGFIFPFISFMFGGIHVYSYQPIRRIKIFLFLFTKHLAAE